MAVDVSDSGVAFGLDTEVLDDAPGRLPSLSSSALDDLESSGNEVGELRAGRILIACGGRAL